MQGRSVKKPYVVKLHMDALRMGGWGGWATTRSVPAAMPGGIAHGMYTKMISLTYQLIKLQHMRQEFRTRITMKDMRACVVLKS